MEVFILIFNYYFLENLMSRSSIICLRLMCSLFSCSLFRLLVALSKLVHMHACVRETTSHTVKIYPIRIFILKGSQASTWPFTEQESWEIRWRSKGVFRIIKLRLLRSIYFLSKVVLVLFWTYTFNVILYWCRLWMIYCILRDPYIILDIHLGLHLLLRWLINLKCGRLLRWAFLINCCLRLAHKLCSILCLCLSLCISYTFSLYGVWPHRASGFGTLLSNLALTALVVDLGIEAFD